MGGKSTSDWSSSGTSRPNSPPPVSRILPQKIREKMPCRTRAVISGTPTTMMEESIRKLVAQVALPATYDWLLPSAFDSANNPPPGYLTVYSTQFLSDLRVPSVFSVVQFFPICRKFSGVLAPKITTGECFFYLTPRPGLTFLREKPYSHGSWKSHFFFYKKGRVEGIKRSVILGRAWAWSLNALPPLNLGDIKRSVKEEGLVDHEFNAKAILEEELLIVAGLHPAPDRYEGPLDCVTRFRIMRNRVAVRKFIHDDVPVMPSSSETRSAPSSPMDIPPKLTPHSQTSPPAPSSEPCTFETPVIEVVTSPEDVPPTTFPIDAQQEVDSPLPSPVEDPPSSHKRPRVSVEGAKEVPFEAGLSQPVFPAPVLTPRMDPQAGAFNMSKAVNRADVEVLTPRTFIDIGNLVLSNASVVWFL
ncbi:hypothetical protein Salat_2546100 [Sesamum alatum]|uniref:Uncharacterized protein n=1 Tax=Sesamum alatum TaxID=300844 RepID=A0AAE1XSJ5_9LAMI|nr:hypothetical protein Salat_2546100 [Sesamum alatum]